MATNNAWNSENPAQVAKGGTGSATLVAYTPICGGTTTTAAVQSVAALGSSGDVLTSNGAAALPTFQAATGAAGTWVKISTGTASASATIDFTGFSATYDHYAVILNNVAPATDAVSLWLRVSTDGGSTYDAGSNYPYIIRSITGPTSAQNTYTAGGSRIHLTGSGDLLGNGANEDSAGIVYIYQPGAAKYTRVLSSLSSANTSAALVMHLASGVHAVAEDTDAIRFLMSSGNIASGTFTLYGIKA